jgi:hypothetical protein
MRSCVLSPGENQGAFLSASSKWESISCSHGQNSVPCSCGTSVPFAGCQYKGYSQHPWLWAIFPISKASTLRLSPPHAASLQFTLCLPLPLSSMPHTELCHSALHHCDKIPEVNNLNGENICFGSWFQRFQSMVTWPCHSGPVARLSIKVGSMWWNKAAYIMVAGKQRERKQGSKSWYSL